MDKEFIQLSRTMAEQCTKERLIELYLAEVENGCEVENKLKLKEKALELACEEQDLYWFDKYAHEQVITLLEYLETMAKEMMKSE